MLLAFVAFGCRSCETIDSSKLDPSEIYQEYSVAVADNTSVRAEFRVSGSTGTTIALVAPTTILHNGRSMNEHLRTVLSGTFYSAETDGFTGSHTFIFTDSSGRQYKNSLNFEPVKIASQNLDLSKSSKTISIPLTRGLADGESITALLTSDTAPPKQATNTGNSNASPSAGPEYSASLTGSVDNDARTFSISTDQLRNFVNGKAKLYITISGSRKPSDVGIRGGSISYSIQSPTATANVAN